MNHEKTPGCKNRGHSGKLWVYWPFNLPNLVKDSVLAHGVLAFTVLSLMALVGDDLRADQVAWIDL